MLLPIASNEYSQIVRTVNDAKKAGVKNGSSVQAERASLLGKEIEYCYSCIKNLQTALGGKHEDILSAMKELRHSVDKLEKILPDELWPLPKYREMLFIY